MEGCNNPSVGDTHLCEEHLKLRCNNCDGQATGQCTAGSMFVCGAYLCERCNLEDYCQSHSTYRKNRYFVFLVKAPLYKKGTIEHENWLTNGTQFSEVSDPET